MQRILPLLLLLLLSALTESRPQTGNDFLLQLMEQALLAGRKDLILPAVQEKEQEVSISYDSARNLYQMP